MYKARYVRRCLVRAMLPKRLCGGIVYLGAL